MRCGECGKIFNGRLQLQKELESRSQYTPEMIKRTLLGHADPTPVQTTGWSLAITLAALALALQAAYMQRDWLSEQPRIGTYVQTLCRSLSWCDLPARRELSDIQLVSRNVYSHPNVDNALMVNAVITNSAGYSQPFPTLLVSMSDIHGRIVARRYFKPPEYFPDARDGETMEPGKSVSINLEVMDPGQDAMAFELDFL